MAEGVVAQSGHKDRFDAKKSIQKHTASKEVKRLLKVDQTASEKRAEGGSNQKGEPFVPKNWHEVSPSNFNKLPLVAKSRYQAYEPPTKEALESKMAALKRLREKHTKDPNSTQEISHAQQIEVEYDKELIGQLKAAEARQRIRDHKKVYQDLRSAEISHLIASQSSAIEALRLKSFLPPSEPTITIPRYLNKQERQRCEALLIDEKGSTIQRRH